MNGVFFKLKAQFQVEENYTGQDIMKEILQTIRVSYSRFYAQTMVISSYGHTIYKYTTYGHTISTCDYVLPVQHQ